MPDAEAIAAIEEHKSLSRSLATQLNNARERALAYLLNLARASQIVD